MDRQIISFQSEDEFVAWARENVQDWQAFVEGSQESRPELAAWRAAGNTGCPPGWVTRSEYERQRALRSGL